MSGEGVEARRGVKPGKNRPEQMFLDLPLEQVEQIDGRFPALVVVFMRRHNFFHREKNYREEVNVVQFLEYIEARLRLEVSIAADPKAHLFTKEDYTFVDQAITAFEEAGYLQQNEIPHQVKSSEETNAVMMALIRAAKQAMEDYQKASDGLKNQIIEKYPNGAP